MSASTTTQLFLFLVAFSYLSAFGSLYWQWSGLYGDDGVTPAAIFFEQRAARITTPSSLERLRATLTPRGHHADRARRTEAQPAAPGVCLDTAD